MTPEEIRAHVDTIEPRTTPDGRINPRHVALESTLRDRFGWPGYIGSLDGPGRFRTLDPVDVYLTGVLSDLHALARCLNPWYLRENPWPSWWPRHPQADELRPMALKGWRWKASRHRLGTLRRNVRRRSAWHGWHAEPLVIPRDLHRIGTGWTRARALRDLYRQWEGSR